MLAELKTLSPLRWAALTFACLVVFGPYYAFDIPAATYESTFAEYFNVPPEISSLTPKEVEERQEFDRNFNLLYSCYSWPNTVLPLFMGVLIDRVGVRRMAIILSLLACVAQATLAIGLTAKIWLVMWGSRMLFGAGTESLHAAQVSDTAIVNWYSLC